MADAVVGRGETCRWDQVLVAEDGRGCVEETFELRSSISSTNDRCMDTRSCKSWVSGPTVLGVPAPGRSIQTFSNWKTRSLS